MALRRERMRLGDLLIKQNVLTEDELKKALALQKGSGKKIGEVLVDNGFITEDMIVRALQMQLGLKVVQLTGVTIPKEVRGLVSVDLLKKYTCIPFELDPYNANILHLAMADPMDMAAIDDISIVTNLQVEPYIASTRDVLAAIDRCYGASETLDAARRFTQERAQLRGNTADEDTDADVSDAPIAYSLYVLYWSRQSDREPATFILKRLRAKFVSVTGLMVRSMSEWSMIIVFFRQFPPVSRFLGVWIFQRKGNRRMAECLLW